MSTPLNHHYVSQCHQREFFDEITGKIFIYDKSLQNFYFKTTTKSLFSEAHSNSKQVVGGIDHSSLEKELKILFEDDFPKHVERIKKFVLTQENLDEIYEILAWITLLGILGELRHPEFKKELDYLLADIKSKTLLSIKSKLSPKGITNSDKKTPYSNIIGYIGPALRVLERMDPLEYQIYSIESNDHFFLPDNSAVQIRGQLKQYSNNLINEIVQVGIPLTDKIFVLATSTKLKANLRRIYFIKEDKSEDVYELNKNIYGFARKAVACKDQAFLRDTVEKIQREEMERK